ncbi:MAG: glutamine synthetase family protein [Gammaproteobacteria bacterium]|nr:glutamine synthetase family protein [Gammaproteobacteria bacterium]
MKAMTNSISKPENIEQLKEWLIENRIDDVECVLPDIVGVARGKSKPAGKFAKLDSTFMPYSIFFQTITGEYIDYDSEKYEIEVDLKLEPDLATVHRVPWANDPTAQVIHDINHLDGTPVGYAPRNVLKRVLKLYENQGWEPVVAPEMEFYLTQKNTDPDYPLEPPVGRSGRQSIGRQSYSIAAIDEYDAIIEDIYDYAAAQGLHIDSLIQEGGPAQLEINLLHGNALELADQVFIFKRLIREAAFKQNCYATFMAKPMDNEPGSAMHIHQSVVDRQTGENIFSNTDGNASKLFRYFIGGQQQFLGAASCIIAPYVNSYRRLVPDHSAPINLEWGVDNRSVGLRVPNSGPEARRIESRLAGADTNPYLAIAANLACGYLGMIKKIEPRQECTGSAYEVVSDGLPRDLLSALNMFEECKPLQELLGEDFSSLYIALKGHEYEEQMRIITPWEREQLLLTV